MANRFYNPGPERGRNVGELFSRIARRYDLINDVQSLGLHRVWKRRVIQLAKARPGQRALDLCSGTGDIAWGLSKAGATVLGLDFNEPMLSLAAGKGRLRRQTQSDRQQGHPLFIGGDAQRLPFPDESFEIVTMAYGLRNLADWETGLREMQRVARPGGRLLVLDFGKPDHGLWRWIYFNYLKYIVPAIGAVICGNSQAYGYILESLKHYPGQRAVARKMGELGLKQVRVYDFVGGVMSINYAEKDGSVQ